MAIGPTLVGQVVILRAAEVRDAGVTIAIRNTPGFDVGLPPIGTDVGAQEDWLRRQRNRGGDFFYVGGSRAPEGTMTEPVVTVGLTSHATVSGPWADGGAWEWGRWASISPDPRVSLEAAALLLALALDENVPAVWVRVLAANRRLAAFHARLGYSAQWRTGDGMFLRAEQDDLPQIIRRLGGA